MRKPAARRKAKPAPNVVIVDKVNDLAAGLTRALAETGWSMRGLALAAGLNAERLRNVGRGRSGALKGDAVALVAEVLGTTAGVLTGAEPWPPDGLQPRPKSDPKEKQGFSLSSDPMADLVRAAEQAAAAANMAATAARQAADAVKMAMSRRSPLTGGEDRMPVDVTYRQPKASRVDPLDRMAYRMRTQGMVRVFDEHQQVQLGHDALDMVGWSPLVAVSILGKAEFLVEDMITGDAIGIYPDPSEAAEIAMVEARKRNLLMSARRRHPLTCLKLRSMGVGEEAEEQIAMSVDEAHNTYIETFFKTLVGRFKHIATIFDGAPKKATEKAHAEIQKTLEQIVESRQMLPEQLHTLATLCVETSQRMRRYRGVLLSGDWQQLTSLREVAYLELCAERLLRSAASGRPTPYFTHDEQYSRGYVRGEMPSPGMPVGSHSGS